MKLFEKLTKTSKNWERQNYLKYSVLKYNMKNFLCNSESLTETVKKTPAYLSNLTTWTIPDQASF